MHTNNDNDRPVNFFMLTFPVIVHLNKIWTRNLIFNSAKSTTNSPSIHSLSIDVMVMMMTWITWSWRSRVRLVLKHRIHLQRHFSHPPFEVVQSTTVFSSWQQETQPTVVTTGFFAASALYTVLRKCSPVQDLGICLPDLQNQKVKVQVSTYVAV